jgi:1-deoxy-D-xylulose-5-phosphate reductoisomerase
MKKIAILGSTGSIGTNAVQVVKNLEGSFKVVSLAANKNIDLLAEQAKELGCKKVVCNEELTASLKSKLAKDCKVMSAIEGMVEIATDPEVDVVLCAVVGTAALLPVLEAIKCGKDIAIASKEILVMAGEIVMKAAEDNNVKMLPVDSEHSAIFQCLEGRKNSDISKVILTASGGAFRDSTLEEIKNAKLEDALSHPTWDMGQKVTIDSASLMNKALEIIEAKWLFGVTPEQIEVVVHPQSIIHSMVEYVDGTVIAQMSVTDMKFPIQYALTYPKKITGGLEPLKLTELRNLSFYEPKRDIFPSIDFAYKALNAGGTLPAVLNAANEIAVEKFVKGEIIFIDIWKIIEKTMDSHRTVLNPTLQQIIDADKWAKDYAAKL